MYTIIKVGNYLQAIKKVKLSQVPLLRTLLPSTPLPSDLTLTVLNCRYEKSKIPSCLNIQLIFLSVLTISNEKT
jgi:hypothetical protein